MIRLAVFIVALSTTLAALVAGVAATAPQPAPILVRSEPATVTPANPAPSDALDAAVDAATPPPPEPTPDPAPTPSTASNPTRDGEPCHDCTPPTNTADANPSENGEPCAGCDHPDDKYVCVTERGDRVEMPGRYRDQTDPEKCKPVDE